MIYAENIIDDRSKYRFKGEWIKPSFRVNSGDWLCFRRQFTVSQRPSKAVLRITVESKYWLWINGELVVFEGQVKNGPAPQMAYYDQIDIGKYLINGTNQIALLTVYFGKNGYGFFDGGQPGLIADLTIDGQTNLVSDDKWLVIKNPAYHAAEEQQDRSYRLAEPDINYYATDSLGNWTAIDFDDHEWSSAVTAQSNFKGYVKRPIPFLKVGPINRYDHWQVKDDPECTGVKIYSIQNQTNLQGTPYLKVISAADRKIEIYTDTWKEAAGHGDSVRHVYHTRNGLQEFEALGWINGYQVNFVIPNDVQVLALGFRPSGYQIKKTGSYDSDSPFMNKLYQKALDTLYVTIRDSFMDCPDRERAQWIGDAVIEMEMGAYSLDQNIYALFNKAINQALNFQHISGAIPTTAPNGIDSPNLDEHGDLLQSIIDSGQGGGNFELPMQSLAFVANLWPYYMYSGDQQPFKKGLAKLVNYLTLWTVDNNGLVSHRGGTWDWMDWGSNADPAIIEECWYYAALNSVIKIAQAIQPTSEELPILQARAKKIAEHFEDNFWDQEKNAYYHQTDNKKPDDRANALVVYSGLMQSNHRQALIQVFKKVFNASPYMEKIVLEALYRLNASDVALWRIYQRYGEMVADEFPTLWEFWNKKMGTRNHAWSGGPLIMMMKYQLGCRPLAPGFKKLLIHPHLTSFNHLEGTIQPQIGSITVRFNRYPTQNVLTIEHPQAVSEVRVDLPKVLLKDKILIDGQLVYQNGRPKSKNLVKENTENFLQFVLDQGSCKHTIILS